MTYRLEGILTQEQRNQLVDAIQSCRKVTADVELPLGARIMLKRILHPYIVASEVILHLDNKAIWDKVIEADRG